MGPTWGRQDPGGPQVGPMILAIWVHILINGLYKTPLALEYLQQFIAFVANKLRFNSGI